MARKLYGAAARAHAKKLARSGRGKRRRGTKRRKNPLSRRRRAARKAAKTRAAKHLVRSRAAKKAARTRRRRHGGGHRRRARRVTAHRRVRRHRWPGSRKARRHKWKANPRRRRARRHAAKSYRRRRRNPAGGRSRRRSHARSRRRYRRRNPRRSTQKSLLRARRAIRNRYKTPLGKATLRRYRMRSNPGLVGGLMDVVKMALPVAGALYLSRAASSKLAGKIPGFNKIPAQYQGTAMAGVLIVGAHFLTKKVKVLQKWRMGVMIGVGINLIDNVVSAFAPASVKAMFGMGDLYDNGLSDYVEVGDYLQTGEPIDDDITMSDYVSVGDVEEELGALEEELGVEEELGADALSRAYLGGVSQTSMMKQIPSASMLAAIPQRSFTREIRRAGPGYDKAGVLYGGIFNGGF